MKLGAAFIVAAASLAFTGEVAAAIQILQNDGFVDDASVGFQEGFVSGESGAVTLGPVEGPFQLRKVQLLFGPSGSGTETVGLSIYVDDGSDEPGTLLLEAQVELQSASDALNEIDLTSEGLEIAGGSIRIAIDFSHSGAPSIARDDDGSIQPGRNWIFAGAWVDSASFGLEGDWIIRAEIDSEGGGTTSSSGATTTSGAGGDDTTASGSSTGPTSTATTGPGATTSGAGGGGSVCVPGETQECVGTDACDGGQSCLDDGSGWSACDCGGGDDGEPATADDGGCGCVAPGGSTGDGVVALALLALAAGVSRRRSATRGGGRASP